jgi:hypothetical protein
MKIILPVLWVLLPGLLSWAQFPNEPISQANGKLFSIHLFPTEKKAKIYIVGTKKAQIHLDGTKPVFEILAKQGKKQQKLEFTKTGDAFEVTELPKWKGPFQLHLKGTLDQESEQLLLDVP